MLNIYDRAGYKSYPNEKVAVLESAYNIDEIERFNAVSELWFTLPASDAKNAHCVPHNFVRWKDGGHLYRIMDVEEDDSGAAPSLRYYCEHVICTLIDTVMFGSVQHDNRDTAWNIREVLARQTIKDWQLHSCEFTRLFSYEWSHENLLAALFSIPNRFDTPYQWELDTSSFPWFVSLKAFDENRDPEFYVYGQKNLIAAKIDRKGTSIANRIYALGYGEGVNQLTIRDVNGGSPYVEDAESIAKYGVIERILEDARYEVPENLLAYARKTLHGLKDVYETYSVDIADISGVDGPKAGQIIQWDDVRTFITEVHRRLDAAGQDYIVLANRPQDIAGSIADLEDRQRISQVYAQGNTVPFTVSMADNADATHPLVVDFFIPVEARVINKVILTWRVEAFRAYSTGAASGGGASTSTASGGGQTTGAGGGTYKSTETALSGSIGTSSISSTSTSGGGSGTLQATSGLNTDTVFTYTRTGEAGAPPHYHAYQYIGNHRHNVAMSVPAHSHGMAHTHTLEGLSHVHGVSIPDHSHTTQAHTHSFSVLPHTHSIEYGIYEGGRATSLQLQVDNGAIQNVAINNTQMDITHLLAVDGGGKVTRGTFHRVRLIPNALTRLAVTLYAQIFIQSEGGGNY